jgi:ferritin-like metal-binding protein YciE
VAASKQFTEIFIMAMTSLEDLFVHFLRDIYYAEKQILKTLPKMARKADSPDLKQAFELHREETEGHVERLEQVFEMLELRPRGVTCDAILGILEEGKEIMSEADSPDALDAGMIAAAQSVEHYEITRYGTLVAWAEQLGKNDAAKLLKEILEQETATDKKLSELAVSALNREAA